MKKLFGFGSATPPPPPVPTKPPSPPASKPAAAAKPSTPPVAKPPATAPAAAAPSIVGRWKEPGGSDTTEFHADGSVTERSGGETIRGRYSLAGGTLKINLAGLDEELSFTATVDRDTLEMTGSDGQSTRYQRTTL